MAWLCVKARWQHMVIVQNFRCPRPDWRSLQRSSIALAGFRAKWQGREGRKCCERGREKGKAGRGTLKSWTRM